MGHYHSCGDNHGIRPPNPEQYLTPLQQKEVAIRHLRTKLLESENTVHDRLVFMRYAFQTNTFALCTMSSPCTVYSKTGIYMASLVVFISILFYCMLLQNVLCT